MLIRILAILITTAALILGIIIVIRALIPVTISMSDAGTRWVQETLPYPTATPAPPRTVTQAPITPPNYPGTYQAPAPQAPTAQQPPVAQAQAPAAAPQTTQASSSATTCKLQQEPFQGFVGSPTVIQHVDFYTDGLNSASFIVGPTTTRQWRGSGSIWQAPAATCAGFDWIADASNYARGRMANGHSGVVVDLRNGQIFNVGTLNQQQVNDLLTRLRAAQN